MRFSIDNNIAIQDRLLTYLTDEYSFNIEPATNEVEFEVLINNLNLTVSQGNNVVQVMGMCSHEGWIPADFEVPKYAGGALKVLTDLEPGFSYRLNKDKNWQVFVNKKTGWICIGNPTHKSNAVEFCKNCIAVLDNEKLVAIWLKPKRLPKGK